MVKLRQANSKFIMCTILALMCATVSLAMLWITMFTPMGIVETMINIFGSIMGVVLTLIMALEAKFYRKEANTQD